MDISKPQQIKLIKLFRRLDTRSEISRKQRNNQKTHMLCPILKTTTLQIHFIKHLHSTGFFTCGWEMCPILPTYGYFGTPRHPLSWCILFIPQCFQNSITCQSSVSCGSLWRCETMWGEQNAVQGRANEQMLVLILSWIGSTNNLSTFQLFSMLSISRTLKL